MKIGIIQTSFRSWGGGEKQAIRLASSLGALGHDVHLYTPSFDRSLFGRCDRFQLHETLRLAGNRIANPLIELASLVIHVSNDLDIINCHNYPTEIAGYFCKAKTGIPVVWMCNEPPLFYFGQGSSMFGHLGPARDAFKALDVRAVRAIDRVVVLDEINRVRVRRLYSRDATIVRTGVDTEFEPTLREDVRRSYDLSDSIAILQVGLSDSKRPIDAIKAIFILRGKGLNVKLILAGKPTVELVNIINQTKSASIIVAGALGEGELSKLYVACDIVVFPAEQTWGLTAVEGMAAGKPVIVSNCAGVAEIVQHGVNGYIVQSRNPKEMATVIQMLARDPNLRETIGNNAKSFISRNLSWKSYAQTMEKIFRGVLENP